MSTNKHFTIQPVNGSTRIWKSQRDSLHRKPPFYRKPNKAISWFKDIAKDHLAHIRDLVAILRSHGIAVNMLKSDRFGYVVYEDEYQIVAEPYTTESY
jgi:hypothetical protein